MEMRLQYDHDSPEEEERKKKKRYFKLFYYSIFFLYMVFPCAVGICILGGFLEAEMTKQDLIGLVFILAGLICGHVMLSYVKMIEN